MAPRVAWPSPPTAVGLWPSLVGVLLVWEVSTWRQTRLIPDVGTDELSVVFLPDSRGVLLPLLRVATYRTRAPGYLVLDTETGREVAAVRDPRAGASAFALSPDGRALATGSEEVHLWDVKTGQETAHLGGRCRSPSAAIFTADGKTIITGSLAGDICSWQTDTGLLKRHDRGEQQVGALWLSPDETRLGAVTAGQQVKIDWRDGSTGALGRSLVVVTKGGPWRHDVAVWSPDGSQIATNHQAMAFDATTGRAVPLPSKNHRTVVAFSHDGRLVVRRVTYPDEDVEVSDVLDGGRVCSLFEGERGYRVTAVAVATAAPRLASVTWSAKERQFSLAASDVATCAPAGKVLRMDSALMGLRGLVLSADGALAAGLDGKTDSVVVWDVVTGVVRQTLHPLGLHSVSSVPLAFSPDGAWLLTGYLSGTTQIWDVATGRLMKSFW